MSGMAMDLGEIPLSRIKGQVCGFGWHQGGVAEVVLPTSLGYRATCGEKRTQLATALQLATMDIHSQGHILPLHLYLRLTARQATERVYLGGFSRHAGGTWCQRRLDSTANSAAQ